MNNSFNQTPFGLAAANCLSNYQAAAASTNVSGNNSGNNNSVTAGHYHHTGQIQQQNTPAAVAAAATSMDMRMAIQQFANSQFVSFGGQSTTNANQPQGTVQLKNVSCLQKEIETLKKQNSELNDELEKLRTAYTECNYQLMSNNGKITNFYEQLQQMQKERLEEQKAFKDLKLKYDDKCLINNNQTESPADERSLFCDECNFEVKSQVALFIHKLNHYFAQSLPRHLQLSTRSFTTMPDDSIQFKYKCHCCEIDPQRQFAKHEIYMHIYQFHTFDQPFKCKYCFLYFTSKSYLNDHLVEKHSISNNSRNSKSGIRGKRTSNISSPVPFSSDKIEHSQSSSSDQLNSTLSLSALTQPMKRLKQEHYHQSIHQQPSTSSNDLNDIFQQLTGEQSAFSETTTGNNHSSTISLKTPEAIKREEEIQKIMNDLTEENSLSCKYPGCKFVATTKNHLKFHISAHLMSKYKCPYCTFVGNRIVEIKRHILKSSKHSDQHVFLCPGCDFASDCEKTFRDHYIRYHDHNSLVDVNTVIEQMFLNESNKIGQNMISSAINNQQQNCEQKN